MSKTQRYNFRCGVCCQSFPEEEQCYQHMSTHELSSSSSQKVITKEEVEVMAPGIPETCTSDLSLSDKSCTNLLNLGNNKELNKEDTALVCPYCDRVLTKPSLLTVHLRSHTNERPFECDLCGKAFKRKTHLTQHRQLHSGVKPYKCLKCSAAYADKCNLNRHNKLYHGKVDTIQLNFSSRRTQTAIVEGFPSSVGHVSKKPCRDPVAENTSMSQDDDYSESVAAVCAGDETEPHYPAEHSDDGTQNTCEIQKNSSGIMDIPMCTELIEVSQSKVPSPSKNRTSVDDGRNAIDVNDEPQNIHEIQKNCSGNVDVLACTELGEVQHSRVQILSNTSDCDEHNYTDLCLEDQSLVGHKASGNSVGVDQSPDSPDIIVCVVDDTCVFLDSSDGKCSTVITVETECETSRTCGVPSPVELSSQGQDQANCMRAAVNALLSKTDESTATEEIELEYEDSESYCDVQRIEDDSAEQGNVHRMLYKCDRCDKEFKSEKSLKYHKKKHTNEGAIRCRICKKDFFKPSVFKVHMRSHTGERPYCCSVCNKSYRDMPQLRDHIKLHTGEHLFPCTECDRVFVKQSGLDVHSRTHTGCKLFECDVCSKTFTTQHHLKRHVRSHTGEKPFPCGVCHLRFGDTSNRKKHMVRRHGDKT